MKNNILPEIKLSEREIEKAPKSEKIELIRKYVLKYRHNMPERCLYIANQGLKLSQVSEDKEAESFLYNNIGVIYWYLSDYGNALENHFKALKISEEIDDTIGKAKAQNNIANVFFSLTDFKKALKYYFDILKIYEKDKNGAVMVKNTLSNIGSSYSNMKKYDKALTYLRRALRYAKNTEDSVFVSDTYNNIGIVYFERKNYKLALSYFNKALKIAEEINSTPSMINIFINIGNLHTETKNFIKSKEFLDKSIKLATAFKALDYLKETYRSYYTLYKAQKNHKMALKYFKLTSDIQDSVLKNTIKKKISGLEFRYQIEKNEKELNELRKQKLEQELKYKYIEENKKILEEKNEEVEKKNKLLEDTNTAKDKFFSIIAHDLKNPFSGIIGLSSFMYENFDSLADDEKMDFIKQIEESSKGSFQLLENLLLWSRAQTGGLKFDPEKINLKIVINECISLLSLYAKNKNISTTSDLDYDIFVFADLYMVKTILRNLINNAIKFTRNRGSIIVSAKMNGTKVETTVSDNGVGITPKDLANLFKLDVKFRNYGTNKETGSGLGLLLCKEFIEKNGGTIKVSSKENEGSHFKFTLPKAS
ncbi:hypothetical protein BH10BAC5_BH10BAC5_15590 [soil metagenome]